MPDDIFSIADRFRAELLTGDRDAANALTAAYADVWQRIAEQLDALTREMEAARKRGEPVTQSWLLRENRLRSLQQQVEGEIRGLEPRLESRIMQQQQQAILNAQDAARQMVMAQLPPDGVFVQFDRLPRSATVDLVGRLQNGSPLRDLLDELGPDASQRVRSALIRGIATGQGPREIARGVREAFGGNLARAQLISRTEVLRSFRESSRRTMTENADVVSKWVWVASIDRRCCAFCVAMHGSFHPLTERMATHPSCRCSSAPVTKSWRELGFTDIPETRPQFERGADVFARRTPAEQLQTLGPGKFALFQRGELELEDLIGFRTSRAWGRTGYERPLYEILQDKRRAA